MKRVLLVTTGFGLLAATATAIAADLPYWNQMPVKAPAYVPVFTWTGFYIGVNGGGAFGTSTYNFGGLGSASFNTSGGLAGGTIGFNYQTGALVWGVEGDGDWSGISGSSTCLGGLSTCQTKNDWLATARGRLGYAFDRVLPYVTGGAAFGDIKAGVPALTIDTANTGWTVRLYYNPLAPLIWLGAALCALGGFVSLSDRRLRIGAPKRSRVAPQAAE